MNVHRFTQTAFAFALALVLAAPAFTQSPSGVPPVSDNGSATVTNLYIQTANGVYVYNVSAAGKPTMVKGSPFSVVGSMEDVNGKYLISVGTYWLHSYPIASNGALGKQVSTIDTQDYGGSQCGSTDGEGSVLDHTGKYLYVALYLPDNDENDGCEALQSFRVESDGHFEYLGYIEAGGDPQGLGVKPDSTPTFSSNDKFAYAMEPSFEEGNYNSFVGFKIASNGDLQYLSNFQVMSPDPPDGNWLYSPTAIVPDNAGHIAAIINPFPDGGLPRLASYSIESNGNIKSTNTNADMPTLSQSASPYTAISMSWSGKLLSVGQNPGFQIYHINGSAPITPFTSVLLPTTYISTLSWDKTNHLYVTLSDSAGMYVYTVTPTSISQVPGSPFAIPNNIYNMIVVPK